MQLRDPSLVCAARITSVTRWPASTGSARLNAFSSRLQCWHFELCIAWRPPTCRRICVVLSTSRHAVSCGRLPLAGLTFTLLGWKPWVTGRLVSPDGGYGTAYLMTSSTVSRSRFSVGSLKLTYLDTHILILFFSCSCTFSGFAVYYLSHSKIPHMIWYDMDGTESK